MLSTGPTSPNFCAILSGTSSSQCHFTRGVKNLTIYPGFRALPLKIFSEIFSHKNFQKTGPLIWHLYPKGHLFSSTLYFIFIMVKVINTVETVTIPEGVKVSCRGRVVTVTGTRGTLTRSFKHLQCDIRIEKPLVKVEIWLGDKYHNCCARTVCSHLKNMFIGVTKVRILFLFYFLLLIFPYPPFPHSSI